MRRWTSLLLALLVTVVLSLNLKAQNESAELSKITDNLINSAQEQLPGWTHKSIPPIEGSRDVSITQWTSGHKMVSVTIIGHSSQEEAVKKIREFVADMKADEKAPDIGEEGYSWGTKA